MVMHATVRRVNPGHLLVLDSNTNNEVRVNFQGANRFSANDNVRIIHDGRMTLSIPPQVHAISIERVRCPVPPQSTPSETRAVVLQRGRGFLIVRGVRDNRRMRVNFAHAHHFCVRQQIMIRHDTIIMNNPPEINAIDITPVC